MFAKRSFTLLLAVLMCSFVAAQVPTTSFSGENRKEAQRLWELAIQAKGGREKLHSIRTFVETRDTKERWSLFKTFKIHIVEAYLLPWKRWTWDDQRPSAFGLSEEMYNYETGMKYFLNPQDPSSIGTTYERPENGQVVTRGVLTPFEPGEKKDKMTDLLVELLEFGDERPIILGTSSEHGSDVIYARVSADGIMIAFIFDSKTHLLREWRPATDKKGGEWFKNYKEFGGIMLPTESGFTQDDFWTHTYEMNPEIDDSIWQHPTPLSLGENGWRKRH